MANYNDDDVKFVKWLEKTMDEEGRSWVWLSEKTGIAVHNLSYRRENFCFTLKEEKEIRKLLKK